MLVLLSVIFSSGIIFFFIVISLEQSATSGPYQHELILLTPDDLTFHLITAI